MYPYGAPLNGTLVNTTKASGSVTENALNEPDMRSGGESCASGFALFFPVSFSFGDGSAYKAAEQNRLKRVAIVDRSYVGAAGHFARACSVVVGSTQAAPPGALPDASGTAKPGAAAIPSMDVGPAPRAPESAVSTEPSSGDHATRCSLVCTQLTDSGMTELPVAEKRLLESGLMPLLDEAARCPSSGAAARQLRLTLKFDARGTLEGLSGTTDARGPTGACLTSLKAKPKMSGPPGRTFQCAQYCN